MKRLSTIGQLQLLLNLAMVFMIVGGVFMAFALHIIGIALIAISVGCWLALVFSLIAQKVKDGRIKIVKHG